ncbi:hypothetical protein AHIS1_p092 [Acaryochloris phage A-HIS1]|nr:hypothetical protein AHIS1_p092 [Acaryochloris phage A-HIS1]
MKAHGNRSVFWTKYGTKTSKTLRCLGFTDCLTMRNSCVI